jgi:hypothetical protein
MITSELVRRLANLARTKNASTFYLNGPPGSGKSYLLSELADCLPVEIPRALALGPYSITCDEAASLGNRILEDSRDMGFLDQMPSLESELDLTRAWRWFRENAHPPAGETFVVLVDLVEANWSELAAIGSLFSSTRYLEGIWDLRNVRVSHICAGYWDHPGLEHYFRSIDTSFPYTVGHNYAVWDGLTAEEITTLIERARPQEAHTLCSRVLFELTGGYPAAALDILDRAPPGDLSFPALLSATRRAAADGPAGQVLLNAWQQLPVECRSVLRDLALQRHIPATAPPAALERLHVAGAIRSDPVGPTKYLNFRSWYVELLVRLHADELGIADEQTQSIRIDELMPITSEMNVEAYRLINDVETQARNFVTIQLCLRKPRSEHILRGISIKHDQKEQAFVDAYDRAIDWQARSADRGLPVDLNPLLAYLSTRDLAYIIEEVGIDMGSKAWQRVAHAIRDLAGVRDAVMHNQLIDDAALQRLYDLQADIYEALSETSYGNPDDL